VVGLSCARSCRHCILKKAGNFSAGWETVNFQEAICFIKLVLLHGCFVVLGRGERKLDNSWLWLACLVFIPHWNVWRLERSCCVQRLLYQFPPLWLGREWANAKVSGWWTSEIRFELSILLVLLHIRCDVIGLGIYCWCLLLPSVPSLSRKDWF